MGRRAWAALTGTALLGATALGAGAARAQDPERPEQTRTGAPPASERAPQGTERAPQGTERAPQGTERAPQDMERAPQDMEREPQGTEREPQGTERAPPGAAQAPRGAREVLGRVLLVEREGVFLLDRAGVITLLGLSPATRFEGGSLRRVSDLHAGQEVRATFEWRGADGVATRIRWVSEGTVEREGAPHPEE